MRNMYYVIGMIILAVSAALGIEFTVAMDAVSAGSGAQIVLMILILASMGAFDVTSYETPKKHIAALQYNPACILTGACALPQSYQNQ